MNRTIRLLAGILLLGFSVITTAQNVERTLKKKVGDYFLNYTTTFTTETERCKLDKVVLDDQQKEVHIHSNAVFAAQPFTVENTKEIYRSIKKLLPAPYNRWKLTVYGGKYPIESLIPNAWNNEIDTKRLWENIDYKGNPWVKNTSRPYSVSHGLEGRHLSVWASHGYHYSHKKFEWRWQRPRLFCTTEDLFTQSFVVPLLIPMLENAGAVIFTPRERDWQKNEIIIDNDHPATLGFYTEQEGKYAWNECGTGFAKTKDVYLDGENPFKAGTVRGAHTQPRKSQLSSLTWTPEIPEDGEYAIYVSYASLPNSITDAQYSVVHGGITTKFKVNQRMGGGTWVYLGTFKFEKGCSTRNCVMLNNQSSYRGMVTADAVRFGGGMGNIARNADTLSVPQISGMPRFLEGARYSAQWSGMPYSIYSPKSGENDYSDDINVRSYMTNYLAGGSAFVPADSGLQVPIEMAFALHSDAGFRRNNSYIGTLGIYTTDYNDGRLPAGPSRLASRDLCDIMLTQLDNDIRRTYGTWQRRKMLDKNYSESREPQVPSMILELLSHQNFADLRMGHDPNFKFLVARAIYKSILKYTATQHQGANPVVQPLPVKDFATHLNRKDKQIQLTWTPQQDALEPTAKPTGYVVYTKQNDGSYNNGTYCEQPTITFSVKEDILYSFKVTAVNDGGQSLPSEELCALISSKSNASILIVNGFQRLAGPQPFENDSLQGFDLTLDPGVPWQKSPTYCGAQLYYNKDGYGLEGEFGLGNSGSELEGMIIAGNTFDFTTLHGSDIQSTQIYSIASCSRSALEDGHVKMHDYDIIDLILGLQRLDGYSLKTYKTFTPALRAALQDYTRMHGNVLVSGAYIASDMTTKDEQTFTANVLKYVPGGSLPTQQIDGLNGMNCTFDIFRQPNEERYAVTWADCLTPTGNGAFCTMLYQNGGHSAAVAYSGNDYRCMSLGFPYESIKSIETRRQMMAGILKFLLSR